MTTSTYSPDALGSLRDSFGLHLDATRKPKTARIYLAAVDGLAAHLAASGMPTTVRAIRREHVESWMAARRATVKPATLSLEYRALAQFFKWAVEGGRDRRLADGEDQAAPRPRPGPPCPTTRAISRGRTCTAT